MELCRQEEIKDNDISELLMNFLRNIQGEKRTRAHWDMIREEQNKHMVKIGPSELRTRFMDRYREKFGKEFILDDYSIPIISKLCHYFTEDPHPELDLKKGLLLYGGVGTGKSSILGCFTHNQHQSFRMVDCLSLVNDFAKDGFDAITKFSEPIPNRFPRESWGQQMITWAFDDLGVESERKHFGNEVNVMAELIQTIYDRRKMIGKVHFTTNLGGQQIAEVYGQRIASRLVEMVNIIEFSPESPDRRS